MTTPQPAALPELPEAAVLAGARELCKIHAGQCGVDADDTWKFYSEQFLADARDCLMASARALAALQSQPAAAGVSDEPDLASKVVNDSCWKFVEAMPHQLPGPIWNDLKPALYAALMHYHRAILALRPQAAPMTDERVDAECLTIKGHLLSRRERDRIVWRMAEAHHGITAPAGGEGK